MGGHDWPIPRIPYPQRVLEGHSRFPFTRLSGAKDPLASLSLP